MHDRVETDGVEVHYHFEFLLTCCFTPCVLAVLCVMCVYHVGENPHPLLVSSVHAVNSSTHVCHILTTSSGRAPSSAWHVVATFGYVCRKTLSMSDWSVHCVVICNLGNNMLDICCLPCTYTISAHQHMCLCIHLVSLPST